MKDITRISILRCCARVTTAVHELFPHRPRETRLPLAPSAYISASLCWRSRSSVIFSLAVSVTGGLSWYKLNQGICLLLSFLLPWVRINPPLSWVPLCYAWPGCTGWAGHIMKSCRQLRSKALETSTGFLEGWTGVAANAGTSYRSAGKAVLWNLTKVHKGDLFFIKPTAAEAESFLQLYLPYPLKLTPHVYTRLVNGKTWSAVF